VTIQIPFNRPAVVGREYEYMKAAVESRHISGNGSFTKRCHHWLESDTGCHRALLTHSCTAALEMAAMLCNVGPGDEVIMPPFTFFATAGSVCRTGARPVFADIDSQTFNLDPMQVENKITSRTRAIMVVHLFGQCADMEALWRVGDDLPLRYGCHSGHAFSAVSPGHAQKRLLSNRQQRRVAPRTHGRF